MKGIKQTHDLVDCNSHGVAAWHPEPQASPKLATGKCLRFPNQFNVGRFFGQVMRYSVDSTCCACTACRSAEYEIGSATASTPSVWS